MYRWGGGPRPGRLSRPPVPLAPRLVVEEPLQRAARLVGAAVKRSLDIAVSALLLVVLLLPFLFIALLIVGESPGPIFYRAERVGRGWRRLRMLKFRTMRCNAGGPLLSVEDDPRFTRVGRILSKAKIDELPQLWHVLRGQMSLVGPRPQSREYAECFRDDYDRILCARPGITGLTQVAFADENGVLPPDERVDHYLEVLLPQKVKLDQMYVARQTLRSDLEVLAWTAVAAILRQPVAVHRATGKMTLRRRELPAHAHLDLVEHATPAASPVEV
jgi:lipopolysaccharide/colanic/teichoic acid biosynthesis glycosyltransferase